MKVTVNLKEKAEKAKKDGYKNVYTVVGAYKATTYCVFYDIQKDILDRPVGYNWGCGRPYNTIDMWTGFPNTRMVDSKKDIMYTELFATYR